MSERGTAACAWVQERLDPLLDGELPSAEELSVRTHLPSCAACAAEWQRARQVQSALRALPEFACPPHVAEAAWVRVSGAARNGRRARAWAWATGWLAPRWRVPAAALACGLLVLAGAASWHARQEVRAAEVARSRAQVEWTLAYVSEVGRRAGLTLRHETAGHGVAAPVRPAPAAAAPARNL